MTKNSTKYWFWGHWGAIEMERRASEEAKETETETELQPLENKNENRMYCKRGQLFFDLD